MIAFWGALILCTFMVYRLRSGLVSNTGVTVVGMDIEGLGLSSLALIAAMWYFGPIYGLAIIVSIMIHEFGHVVAYRIAGHDDARFRLIPLMGGVAISDKAPESQLHSFFIAIMGPGICIAPMMLAFALSDLLAPVWTLGANFFWAFAIVTGALNFFNLLPFWPLDGGRCVRIITDAFAPRATAVVTLGMSAAFAALGVAIHSTVLFVVALIGAQSLFTVAFSLHEGKSLTKWQAVQALLAYLFTIFVYLAAGLPMIERFF